MYRQQLLGHVRRAAQDFNMLEEGDCVAVGLSGGKDSAALLCALAGLRRFYPAQFSLIAVSVLLGFEGENPAPAAELCAELNVPFYKVETDIGQVVFDERKEKNPCSLCSKMRKGALNDEAKLRGANKIALAHNKDDLIQTFFMSLFYEGRLHTFEPVSVLDRVGLVQIRPLIYVDEADAAGFVRKYDIPTARNPCPANGNTKREEIKGFIADMSRRYASFRAKTFTAVCGGLLEKTRKENKI